MIKETLAQLNAFSELWRIPRFPLSLPVIAVCRFTSLAEMCHRLEIVSGMFFNIHPVHFSKPGIRHGYENSRGYENGKSQNKLFSMGKQIDKHTFFSMKIKMMDQ